MSLCIALIWLFCIRPAIVAPKLSFVSHELDIDPEQQGNESQPDTGENVDTACLFKQQDE